MASNCDRLAQILATRREELGLTQEDVQERGGPSANTVREWERGNIPTGRTPRKTMWAFDTALDWERGSTERVRAGEGDPEPLLPHSVTSAQNGIVESKLGVPMGTVRLQDLTEAMLEAQRLKELAAAGSDIVELSEEIADRLSAILVDAVTSRLSPGGIASTIRSLGNLER
ncbi:helix-turn-helix transcriptional regulator [Rhodococcus sp. D2-41]|uniref:helix-turn-helix domain-containing protein n=1 Tax=Speluncibacter jeojiensis TaxID=2710754 RepID=UPI00240EA418|nr:helix-turn-helix transcriptional regulator [Rhodococcus sp. D2-41]MDG3012419.1 helix-turn-helix transcriptional regulator [Rhodococcus sp. D2-41]